MKGWIVTVLAVGLLAGGSAADTIELNSGELISGAIIERSGEAIVVAHEILGRLEIPLSAVASINGQDLPVVPSTQQAPPPAEKPELPPPPSKQVVEATQPVAEPSPKAQAELPRARLEPKPEEPKPAWKQSLDIGLNASAGNVDSRNARFQYQATQKAPDQVLKFDTWYRANKREDRATRESFSAGLFSEWPRVKERDHNVFAQARYDYADFQSWDQRLTASGGFGWQVLDVDHSEAGSGTVNVLDVTLRGGGGFRREWGLVSDDLNPEAMLGTELAWRINQRQSVSASSTVFPNLDDHSDYRLVNNVAWDILIDELDGINLKLSLNHEFESQVPAGFEHNDVTAHAAVVFNF